MVSKEVCENYYNVSPIWVQHASIHVKKVRVLKSKKVIVKVCYKMYSEPLLEPESESKEIISPRNTAKNMAKTKVLESSPKHA